jgi:serine/threonine protein kinase/Leucine-rich repeat (LRR) protein
MTGSRLVAASTPVGPQQPATEGPDGIPAPRTASETSTIEPVPGQSAEQVTSIPPLTGDPPEASDDPTKALVALLLPPQLPDEIGRLGPYRILQILGVGGMGVVFKAEDTQLLRPVALKAMLPTLAGALGNRQRFLREARGAAAIKHEHIVTIYQVGEDRGLPFMAMELLQGQSLQTRLDNERVLPIAEVLRIGKELAEGLAGAHERGLVHRDIKPANIWLEGRRARVKILDFGLVRAAGEDTQLTRAGAIIGTPAYMSPEQARGKPADARSDLFSLGSVLYRMATGEVPFKGSDTVSTLVAVSSARPIPPRKLNPTLPPALADLILRLLAKEADTRPPSAQRVADHLRAIRHQQGTPSAPHPGNTADDTTETFPPVPVPADANFRNGSHWRRGLIGAALLGLAALVLLGLILTFRTKHGTLVVTVTEPDVQVSVDGEDKVTIDSKKAGRIDLLPGEHHLTVRRGDEDLYTSSFVIKRGGETIIDAKWERKPLSRTAASKPIPPVSPDHDRQVAEWILSLGEGVWVMLVAGGERYQVPPARLPTASFHLERLHLGDKRITDEETRRFAGLKHVDYLVLRSPSLTDAALENLKEMDALEWVDLEGSKVTDEGLKCLQGLTRLSALNLNGTKVTDAGLPQLVVHRDRLVALFLGACEITDKGLESLSNLTKLRGLILHGTKVSDAGLSALQRMTELENLGLNGTRISDAGLQPLRALTTLRALHLDGTGISDEGLEAVKGMAQLETLNLVGTVIGDHGLEKLRNLRHLKHLNLEGTKITDTGLAYLKELRELQLLVVSNTPVSDPLQHLKGLTSLDHLGLRSTKITDDGLKHLAGLRQLRYLDVRGTNVSGEAVQKLKTSLPGCTIDR